MADLGLRVAVGNFSTGTPEADEFAAFLPAGGRSADLRRRPGVARIFRPGHVGWLRRRGAWPWTGKSEFGALTLRYRFWYRYYLQPNDLVIPLVITETGIDGGVLADAGGSLSGWQDFTEALGDDEEPSYAPITAAEYLDQLSWYDDELRRDDYVLGCAVFNAGDETGTWGQL